SGVKGISLPLADAPAGVYGQSTNGTMGVLGVVDPTASSGAGVAGVGSPNVPAGYFEGNIIVTGQIFAGIKDAIVPFADGSQRVLHCMESPEHWFEDFGTAKLKRGRTVVKLDADFAKVIKRGDYHVFLTPKGDCRGLCVRRQGGASFEVRELQGGTSSIAFSYRIVGKRKDIKRHTRFAKIETPIIPIRGPRGLPSSMRALFTAVEKEARKRGT